MDLRYAEKIMENIKAWEKPRTKSASFAALRLGDQMGQAGSFSACSTYDKKNPD